MAAQRPPLATIAPFREALRDPAATAAAWKADGGKKVVGTRCLYVPEEIVWAAGMLPFPLYGTAEPVRLADAYFQPCTCEFVRSLFDLAMGGRMGFVDFLATANTCDVVRRLYDMWSAYIPGLPAYIVNNPQKLLDETGRAFFLEELRLFRAKMEELSGNAVTDGKLRDAIALYNGTRALLAGLYALRAQDPPPLSGVEAFEIAVASTILPRDRANPLLSAVLEEVRARATPAAAAGGPRILVTGSVMDDPALIRMIEEEGGVVVADDLCTTTRGFRCRVDEEGDPMEALSRFFDERPLCACMHPQGARLDYVMGLVDEFGVGAVVNFNLKYCHPSLYEAPLLRRALEARGIPSTTLEVGHDLSGHGQLRTRIQAFLEMVEA